MRDEVQRLAFDSRQRLGDRYLLATADSWTTSPYRGNWRTVSIAPAIRALRVRLLEYLAGGTTVSAREDPPPNCNCFVEAEGTYDCPAIPGYWKFCAPNTPDPGPYVCTRDITNYTCDLFNIRPCNGLCGYVDDTSDCSHCAFSAGGKDACTVEEGEEQTLLYDDQCQCCYVSTTPLLVNLHGGISVSDAASGVWFDLAAEGVSAQVPWPTSDTDGWLVLDRNKDGTINDGRELFGTSSVLITGRKAANGFVALQELDSDGDGAFTAADPMFSEVAVWIDRNRDGISQPDELLSLQTVGLLSISLDYRRSEKRDRNGNRMIYRALARFENGSTRFVYDVFLPQHPVN